MRVRRESGRGPWVRLGAREARGLEALGALGGGVHLALWFRRRWAVQAVAPCVRHSAQWGRRRSPPIRWPSPPLPYLCGCYRALPVLPQPFRPRPTQDESEPSYELPYADEPPAPAVEYRTSQDGGAGLRSGPRGLPLGGDAPGLSGAETQASGTSPAPGASASAARGGPVTPGGAGCLGASGQARSLLGDGVGGAAGADGGGGDEPAIARPGGSRSRTRVPFCVAGSIGMLHSRGALNDG